MRYYVNMKFASGKVTLLTLLSLLISIQLIGVVNGLRSTHINVPRAVLAGARATLSCSFDLEGAPLYSIRWYRNMVEFYRYVPKEEPPTRVFPLSGVDVDVSDSDDHQVTLIEVKRDLAGTYQCEVSADAPSFHTDMKAAEMMVVETPITEPIVTADRLRYSAGDNVRANCSSSHSYPAANITWFVNEQRVPGFTVSSVVTSPDGTQSAMSSLELETNHLGGATSVSKLRLRCEASLYDLYRESSQTIEVKEDRPQLASVLGHSPSGGSWKTTAPGNTRLLSFLLLFLSLFNYCHINLYCRHNTADRKLAQTAR